MCHEKGHESAHSVEAHLLGRAHNAPHARQLALVFGHVCDDVRLVKGFGEVVAGWKLELNELLTERDDARGLRLQILATEADTEIELEA